MGFMMPKPPTVAMPAMPATPPPPPAFGMVASAGGDLRKQAQQNKARAAGGSLMGSQLASASTGGKSLMGQTG